MTKSTRIQALALLGEWMLNLDDQTNSFINALFYKNPWYTTENINKQFKAIGNTLNFKSLEQWALQYEAPSINKTVGLILAGNLPLVGFHDILCTLIMGFNAQIKVSSDDAGLTSYVLNKLIEIEPQFKEKIFIVDKLENFDIVIATGSNNTARYFEYYFGKKPHIIRKNRNSIAVLHGNETQEEIYGLGNDILDYFGLGCRSVSKIFIPKGYDISKFFEPIESHSTIKEHYKYINNYEYNKSIYLINGDKHFDNGFLLLKEDKNLASPLAVVFYEEYEDLEDLEQSLELIKDNIQCLVSSKTLNTSIPTFALGQSQKPSLTDYADGVNTLEFLAKNY